MRKISPTPVFTFKLVKKFIFCPCNLSVTFWHAEFRFMSHIKKKQPWFVRPEFTVLRTTTTDGGRFSCCHLSWRFFDGFWQIFCLRGEGSFQNSCHQLSVLNLPSINPLKTNNLHCLNEIQRTQQRSMLIWFIQCSGRHIYTEAFYNVRRAFQGIIKVLPRGLKRGMSNCKYHCKGSLQGYVCFKPSVIWEVASLRLA